MWEKYGTMGDIWKLDILLSDFQFYDLSRKSLWVICEPAGKLVEIQTDEVDELFDRGAP